MADNVLSTLASALYELRVPLQTVFPTEHVLLAELSGVGERDAPGRFTYASDTNREVFTGSKYRIPIMPHGMQSGGTVSETGTINVPSAMDVDQATGNLVDVVVPFSISVDLEEDSQGNSAMEALPMLMEQARIHMAEIENDQFNNQLALIQAVSSNSGSGSLVVPVGTTNVNWDALYAGRVVDILTASNGADPGQGKRRKIVSFDESAGTVTFSTTATASDGGSGNITFSSSESIYVTGSYATPLSGLEDVCAVTGTFQAIDKAGSGKAYWKGTDGRGGTTTTAALSQAILDGAVARGRRSGIYAWDFGLGDPKVIDLYKQSLYSLVRYDPQTSTLPSGFSGITYDGASKPFPLVKEPRAPKGKLKLIDKASLQLFGRSAGPDFLADDGAPARRFSRNLSKEVWMLDRVQLVAKACNRQVFINNLSQAA